MFDFVLPMQPAPGAFGRREAGFRDARDVASRREFGRGL